MRKIDSDKEFIYGLWKDSEGKDNNVQFKKQWGSHKFTDREIEDLLAGKEICFSYVPKDVKGHLQYINFKGHKSFHFCPDFDDAYEEKPIFDSTYEAKYMTDKKNEEIMNEFMKVYYYSKLYNSDGTKVEAEYIQDKAIQKQGIDVIYTRNAQRYTIDEKAQLDYITNPLPTFALEILNSSSGKKGWFINDDLKTEYYMFIWPFGKRDIQTIEDIEYVDYALVERVKLKNKIRTQEMTNERLFAYATILSEEKLKGAIEKENKLSYKEAPFNDEIYLVYTKAPKGESCGKKERPVNLIIKKRILQQLAEEHGRITKKSGEKE